MTRAEAALFKVGDVVRIKFGCNYENKLVKVVSIEYISGYWKVVTTHPNWPNYFCKWLDLTSLERISTTIQPSIF